MNRSLSVTFKASRKSRFVIAKYLGGAFLAIYFIALMADFDIFRNLLVLPLLLGILLNLYSGQRKSSLEEVRVDKEVVSAWYRDGKSVIVNRENEAHFTEYGDCIVIGYRSFDRAQSLRIARWKFEPEVWQAFLEEIRQVLRND